MLLALFLACAPPQPDPPTPDPAPLDRAALEARRVALKTDVKALVAELSRAGRYDCCILIPCEMCAMRMGGCACGEGLRKSEPVCEECAMMWRAGQGAEPDVKPEDVRTFLEAEKEMTMRARGEMPGCSCPAHEGAAPAGAAAPAAPAAAAPTSEESK